MLNVPAQESVYTTKYTDFKGVDFTSQVCSMKRFPKAKNFIISDMVEKRPGYKTLKQFEGKINGLFSTIIEDVHYFIIHAGENLYAATNFSEEPILLLSGINNSKSSGFYSNGYYYILTGKEYIQANNKTARVISDETYRNWFYITSEKSYRFDTTYPSYVGTSDAVDNDYLECEIKCFGNDEPDYIATVTPTFKGGTYDIQQLTYEQFITQYAKSVVFEKKRNINSLTGIGMVEYPGYSEVNDFHTTYSAYAGVLLPPDAERGTDVVIELSTGECYCIESQEMRFSDGTLAQYFPTLGTASNPVKVYYRTNITNTKVYSSKVSTFIQYGNGMYYFFTGNSSFPNRDWQSALNDPTYFPSDNYSIYGTEDEILGYGQYGEYVAIFKKGGNDNNIYIKSVQDIDGLGVTFPTSVGVGGAIGGVSSHTIKNLNGETLYLTREGIYALTSLSTTNMKITRNRSFFVDGRLLKEENLENAIATVWKNKYVLCINSHCYILDGAQPLAYREGSNNDYVYECLYWDNIPATSLLTKDNELYFGTEDGRICVFTDGTYTDDGSNIDTMIATVLDDDGNYMALKKMKKKGTGLLVKPYVKSSFDISFLYDNFENTHVKTAYADIFDFDDMDFERVSFETSSNPRIIPFLKKSKKYKAMQIVLRSNNNEPFGFMSIIKRYTFNNYVKRS